MRDEFSPEPIILTRPSLSITSVSLPAESNVRSLPLDCILVCSVDPPALLNSLRAKEAHSESAKPEVLLFDIHADIVEEAALVDALTIATSTSDDFPSASR